MKRSFANLFIFIFLFTIVANGLYAQRSGSTSAPTRGTTGSNGDKTPERVPSKSSNGSSSNTNSGNKNNTQPSNQQTNNNLGKLFWGGGVNTTTDGKNFIVDAQPFVGYRLTPSMQLTAGPVYQYQSGNDLNIYGARLGSRYDIAAGAFAAGMFEFMNYRQNDQNRSVARLPLGVGYNHNLFGMGANLSVMYDVLHKSGNGSPYATPFIISGGVTIGSGNRFNFGNNNFNINDVFNINNPTNPNKNTNSKAADNKTNNKTNSSTNTKTKVSGKVKTKGN
ncbi:MAG: hypothetical protein IPL33_09005 [Sphingobacteriales bacterium]|jgi:hypothetical protein|nr:hypothetical protein [Sphingobacteriales bacterium]MCC7222307.1 hypothetical protein [Chitinophagales bacterium]